MPDFPIDPELRIRASPPIVLRRTIEAVNFIRKVALRTPDSAREARLCSCSVQAQSDFQTGLCMQIAQIAPLTEAIPPKLYGGTERVISWLADELVALGHDVVLFASGDSRTSAN